MHVTHGDTQLRQRFWAVQLHQNQHNIAIQASFWTENYRLVSFTDLYLYRTGQNHSCKWRGVHLKTISFRGTELQKPDSWVAGIKGLVYCQSCNLNYFSKLPGSLLPFCACYLHCSVIIGHVSLLEFISRDLTLPVSGHKTTAFINPSFPVPRLAWWISSRYSSLVNIHKTELSA